MPEKRQAQDHLASPTKRSAKSTTYSSNSAETEAESFIKSATKAIIDSRLDDAITQSSSAFNSLSSKLIDILQLRSQSWSKKAKSAEEHEDALLMMLIEPKHHAGYLRAGKLYSMQGYQDVAMETFKKGLDNISPSDSNYTNIQRGYEWAKVRSQSRVNFLAKCPNEVGSCIIGHLTYDAIVESLAVSRVWRNKLLENPSCWKTFTVKHAAKKSNRLLPTVSPHIEELTVKDMRWFHKALNVIKRHEFPKLHTLNIYHEDDYIKETKSYRSISNVLATLSKTLTHLYIDHISIEPPCLSVILLICRNLTNLKLSHMKANAEWLVGLSLPYMTSLTHLSLTAYIGCGESNKQIGELLR
ncbi:hypothetical protein BJV82DRAFT_353757 [Fennellomyces sp. T-0311]|nr:hypothetical protein BJV82DRAFT_353757 [Fennellomyces sp. T-0311]